MPSVLIAGPTLLEDLPQRQDVIAGAGAYAAIAAAALVHTQLWSSRPAGFDAQKEDVLARRPIDLAGFSEEGQPDEALPAVEPVSAEDLAAALVIGLPPEEERRALDVLDQLDGETSFLRCLRPLAARHDAESLQALAERADLLIIDQAGAAHFPTADQALDRLLEAGCRAVLLTAGPLGGLLAYKAKRCTWPSLALPGSHPGRSAIFAGALVGLTAEQGHLDWRGLKRNVATASAVAGAAGTGIGPIKLLGMDRADYQTQFLRQRRNNKS